MRVGSLFAGIAGFDLGFEQAGFEAVWQVEKEPFCIAVLKTRFPNVVRYYEIKDCGRDRKHKLSAVDVVTAGFPCQDLSVAGKRAGLAGTRSGLFWELTRILGELQPPWIVIENVPGLFSSSGGEDFAAVLRELGNIGYGLAWRVLDSQFFRVAQRRRRLFIVGCFGKPCPAEILFESEGGEGNSAKGGEAWPGIAGPLGGGAYGAGRRTEDDQNYVAATLSSANHDKSHAAGRRREDDVNLICNALCPVGGGPDDNDAQGNHLIAASLVSNSTGGFRYDFESTGAFISAAPNSNGVRDFAELPEGLDSARYRALGNAVTVSVSRWIAQRIKAYEERNPERN